MTGTPADPRIPTLADFGITGAGVDTHPGKAQVLRDYWTGHGHGGPTHYAFEKSIGWGTPGDFDRCVTALTAKGHMTPEQAKGYCNLRHHEALGIWPAQHAEQDKAHASSGTVTVPALVTLPNVDLLAAGTWELSSGRNTFTRDDIQHAIEAAQCPAVGQPVIKLGHVDDRFDGEPAIGRVANLRADPSGSKLVGDLTDMPGWLGAITHAAFPRRSVEGAYNFRCQVGHDHPFVLTALALLGITSPGVGVLNSLPDIASLYGVQAASAGETWRTAPMDVEGDAVPVTEEDVRRAYYANSGAPSSWWITELQMAPTQLVVADGKGKIYRVPFTITDDSQVQFAAAEPLTAYADLAATRGTGQLVTYASAAESRAVKSAGTNGWVQRDGDWVYDPDGDGDNDAAAETDSDNSHWDADGNMKPGVKIPPKPTSAASGDKPYGDVKYADPKNGKYPIDTAAHARAAWSYINQDDNASKYPMNGVTLSEVKAAIKAACKHFGIDVSASAMFARAVTLSNAAMNHVAASGGDDDTRTAVDELNMALTDAMEAISGDAGKAMSLVAAVAVAADDLAFRLGVTADAATAPTLNGDELTGDKNNAMMTHGAFTGTHTHAHPAFGAQGDDKTHSHKHTHSGDAAHNHAHTNAAANKEGGSDVEFTAEQEANLRTALGLDENDALDADRVVTAASALQERVKVSASGRRGPLPPGVVQISEEVWNQTMAKVEASERFVAKVKRDERDEVIDKAIRDGKFSAASRSLWVRQWDADPEAARETLASLKKNVVPVSDIGGSGGNLDDEAYEQEFAGLYPPGTFKSGR